MAEVLREDGDPVEPPAQLPDAVWWSEDAGQPGPTTVRTGGAVSWNRSSFPDDLAVTRQPVTLAVSDGLWAVHNGSGVMPMFLLDRRNGRRPVPPRGSLGLVEDLTHVLFPRTRTDDAPFVVTVALPWLPSVPARPGAPAGAARGDQTQSAGEPDAETLVDGLLRARELLANPLLQEAVAAYARPYFVLSCADLAPEHRKVVAQCLAKSSDRGERALTAMREALWGTARAQPTSLIIELLLRHRLLTWEHVRAVPHVRCGHHDDELFDARERRWAQRIAERGRREADPSRGPRRLNRVD